MYRRPFTGATARRYTRFERPAFGDLDHRVIATIGDRLATARRVVDVGAGPGHLGAAIRTHHPGATVIAVEPSPDFPAMDGVPRLRARAESLPLATGSADLAIALSSIRHVADRRATLAELRRIVRPGGALVVVELDPDASRARASHHARRLRAPHLRAMFAPLVLRTAPPRHAIATLATDAGWRLFATHLDPIQPVYVLCFA